MNEIYYTADKIGFIRLVDVMGNDYAITQAARVSYGAGTKSIREDSNLIKYLLRNEHMSPFEMCELKFHIKVPMDTWRQWIRHRTANVNEYSTRYSIAISDYKTTSKDEWRLQSINNKQGSYGVLNSMIGEELTAEELELHSYINKVYNNRLERGVAKELARKDLPLCTYTEAYWKIDLRNLLHFLKLRLDSHAQAEIREYANILLNFVKELFPLTYEAFTLYVLNAITFSETELRILKPILDMDKLSIHSLSNSEEIEFKNKLQKLKNF
ncbi:MAG TPA: FAD-dependent thymidylate synthase [Thermotogota bacterium]|nr:FAD-dependent thymidylate synthase [Thermotogota bacterium]